MLVSKKHQPLNTFNNPQCGLYWARFSSPVNAISQKEKSWQKVGNIFLYPSLKFHIFWYIVKTIIVSAIKKYLGGRYNSVAQPLPGKCEVQFPVQINKQTNKWINKYISCFPNLKNMGCVLYICIPSYLATFHESVILLGLHFRNKIQLSQWRISRTFSLPDRAASMKIFLLHFCFNWLLVFISDAWVKFFVHLEGTKMKVMAVIIHHVFPRLQDRAAWLEGVDNK